MAAPQVNFSDLLNRPKETLGKLQSSPTRSLRLHRRAEEDLVLTTTSRVEQVRETVSATTRLFVAMMRVDSVRADITEIVPVAFPWVRYLPDDEVPEFIRELVEALEAGESLDNYAPVVQVLAEWRHTAEVYADPELLRILTAPIDDEFDFEPVPKP